VDLDKLELVFELTRLIQRITDENQDTSNVLKLFLNTLYILNKLNRDEDLIISTFKIKLFCLLGFMPHIQKCANCGQVFENLNIKDELYYDYVSNQFACKECTKDKDKRRYIKINKVTIIAIEYIMKSDIKKVFNFELKDVSSLKLFSQVYSDAMIGGI
jgi:DNA repair protein RecO